MTDFNPTLMRAHVQNFYEALRNNDIPTVQKMLNNDFPLEWAQSFAETSLPEYAMSHGSVECAWLIMSRGIMPEKWSAFTGEAWKAFLKKGWEMAMSNETGNLSLDAYQKIARMGLKITGQNFPSWMDKIMSDSTTTAARMTTTMLGGVGKLWGRVLERWETDKSVDPASSASVFVKPIKMNRPVTPKSISEEDVPPLAPETVVAHRAKQATKPSKTANKTAKRIQRSKPSTTQKPLGPKPRKT